MKRGDLVMTDGRDTDIIIPYVSAYLFLGYYSPLDRSVMGPTGAGKSTVCTVGLNGGRC